MNRIYNDNIRISAQGVQDFFEKRFNKDDMLASVMLRSKGTCDIAHKRDANEGKIIESFLEKNTKYAILDIGCGCGRLVNHLQQHINVYDGVDFTPSYIVAANEIYRAQEHINFYQMSATMLDRNILDKSYDFVFITGLCPYLNDEDIEKLFTDLPQFLASNARLYIRESISVIDTRLTLKDFPSEELETNYSAIYRTPKEYETFFQHFLPQATIIQSQILLTKETGAREETNQQFWLMDYAEAAQ